MGAGNCLCRAALIQAGGCTWILGAVRWGCPGSQVQGRALGVPLQSLAPSQLSEKLASADPGSGEQRLEAAPKQLKGEVARGLSDRVAGRDHGILWRRWVSQATQRPSRPAPSLHPPASTPRTSLAPPSGPPPALPRGRCLKSTRQGLAGTSFGGWARAAPPPAGAPGGGHTAQQEQDLGVGGMLLPRVFRGGACPAPKCQIEGAAGLTGPRCGEPGVFDGKASRAAPAPTHSLHTWDSLIVTWPLGSLFAVCTQGNQGTERPSNSLKVTQ